MQNIIPYITLSLESYKVDVGNELHQQNILHLYDAVPYVAIAVSLCYVPLRRTPLKKCHYKPCSARFALRFS